MKNKTLVIIVIGAVIAIAAVAVLIVILNKKTPATTTTTQTNTSTGNGGVSTGASPDLVTVVSVGSGAVVLDTPKTSTTQPYATTAPRVESPAQTSDSGVALQNAGGSTQQTATNGTSTDASGQIAYNYNQSDDSFLNTYYPDAQQVLTGNEGPNGNYGQDPSNQVLYVNPPAPATGPDLTAPDGSNLSSIPTSSDNTPAAINAYLKALSAATASFDVVNNTNLVTAPLQDLSASEAATNGQQAAAVLQAISALKVPSSVVDLQASYLGAYEEYITYAGQLSSFLNSNGTSSLNTAGSALQTTVNTISTVLSMAQTNYQNVATYYNQ